MSRGVRALKVIYGVLQRLKIETCEMDKLSKGKIETLEIDKQRKDLVNNFIESNKSKIPVDALAPDCFQKTGNKVEKLF